MKIALSPPDIRPATPESCPIHLPSPSSQTDTGRFSGEEHQLLLPVERLLRVGEDRRAAVATTVIMGSLWKSLDNAHHWLRLVPAGCLGPVGVKVVAVVHEVKVRSADSLDRERAHAERPSRDVDGRRAFGQRVLISVGRVGAAERHVPARTIGVAPVSAR